MVKLLNSRKPLLAILLFFLVAKFVFFLIFYSQDNTRVFTADSTSYYEPAAETLLRLGRFSQSDNPDMPEIHLTPGYPFFLAKIYSLFGINQIPVVIVQILLGGATIVLTYTIAKKLWNHWIGVAASIFLALDPGSFASPFFLMTETIFSFFLLLAVFGGIRLLQDKKNIKNWAFVLGFALALAILTRPIAYYLIVLLGLGFFIYVARVKRFEFKKTVSIGLLIAIPLILFIGGWKVRNFIVSGSPTFAHVTSAVLFDYTATEIIMRRDKISYEEANRKLRNSLPSMEGWPEAKKRDFLAEKGLSIIKQHPLLFAQERIYGLTEMLFMPYETDIFRLINIPHESVTYIVRDLFKIPFNEYVNKWLYGYTSQFALFSIMETYIFFLYANIAVSLWKIRNLPDKQRLLIHILLGILILYFLALSESAPRFRVPIMPYLSIFGAIGLYSVYKYIRKGGLVP